MAAFIGKLKNKFLTRGISRHCDACDYIMLPCSAGGKQRFVSPYLRGLFSFTDRTNGRRETPDCAYYEVGRTDFLTVSCILDVADAVSPKRRRTAEALMRAVGAVPAAGEGKVVLMTWYRGESVPSAGLYYDLDRVLWSDIPIFEAQLQKKLEEAKN